MAQLYRRADQPLSPAMQAQLYYARKRRKARAEATSGLHGGLRILQQPVLGITVTIRLTTI